MQNFMVHLGSNDLSSGSEHHACRASFINSEHQGTSTQGVVTGFDITLQRTSGHIILGCSEYCFVNQAHLPLCPRLQIKLSYQPMILNVL